MISLLYHLSTKTKPVLESMTNLLGIHLYFQDAGMSFVLDVHFIFAQQAIFLLKWLALLDPFHALFADTESSLLSNCLVPQQREANYTCPLVFVHHVCFTLVSQTVNLPLVHGRYGRTVLLQFLQIYYVQLPVAHFLLSLFLCAHATMVHAHHLNLER